MKRWPLAFVVALPMCGVGCGFAQNIRRNIVISPLYSATDRADHHRQMQMAREAYKQMALAYPEQEFSCDYREGFVDGFVDYLSYGGVGEPPPIPPSAYRFYSSMTPEGLAAMDDWKNGFRHGSATARASNLRDVVTLPVYWGPTYSSDGPKRKPKETEELPAPQKKAETDKPVTDTPPPEPVRPK